ncbi:INO80 complex subunit B [Anabrus simplex]|uniref:INO80 complex subunit B n=1 Tax=Anabrus simplex TaxID=316456 RepID=UPI0035A36A98
MTKHKESTSDEDTATDGNDTPQKRHKRHKHKKHKKKKQEESESSVDLSLEEVDPSKGLMRFGGKIKIKIGRDEKSDKSKERSGTKSGDRMVQSGSVPKTIQKKKKGKGKDSGTSSEEERWLDAIESGKLEEVDDELKKIKPKDPKLMTARQRAMFERKTDKEPSPGGEQLLALPSGYKEKVMTAEALQKAALKSQKRKQLADEKREKDMKKTMDRLLKKQESKGGKSSKVRSLRTQVPRATYKISDAGVTVSLPVGYDYPLKPQKISETSLSSPVMCGIIGCRNRKRYNCPTTGIPLCSLSCFRKKSEIILL